VVRMESISGWTPKAWAMKAMVERGWPLGHIVWEDFCTEKVFELRDLCSEGHGSRWFEQSQD